MQNNWCRQCVYKPFTVDSKLQVYHLTHILILILDGFNFIKKTYIKLYEKGVNIL